MYAVWFTFDAEDEQYLSEKIRELSIEYASKNSSHTLQPMD